MAIHWRRGDQLTEKNRCGGGYDSSVNCGSVKNFMYEVKNILRKHHIQKTTAIYVATNEADENILSMLEENKLFTSRNLKENNFDLFTKYVIDLTILCYSKYLLFFGMNSI